MAEVKCGLCGAECREEHGDTPALYWTCPLCGNEATASEHIQQRNRRINEAALVFAAPTPRGEWNCNGGYITSHPKGDWAKLALEYATALIAAQDAAAQKRGGV